MIQRVLFVFSILKADRSRTTWMIALLLCASVLEGIGLAFLLPFVSLVLQESITNPFAESVRSFLVGINLMPSMALMLSLMTLAIILKASLIWFSKRQVGYATAAIAADFRHRLIESIVQARWSHYIQNPAGGLANSLCFEVESASNTYLQSARFVADSLTVILYLLLAFLISWQISVAAIITSVFSILALHRFFTLAQESGRAQTMLLKSASSHLVDRLGGFKALKAMGKENCLSHVLAQETEALNIAKRQDVLAKEGLMALQEPITMVALSIGFYAVSQFFNIAGSALLVLAFLFLRTMTRVSSVQSTLQNITGYEAAYCSLNQTIAAAEAQKETFTGTILPKFEHNITLSNLSFRYTEQPILNTINITLPAGTFTALTGPSGSGKTTLVDLITGLLQPTTGKIAIDGTQLTKLDIRAWRNMIGYVPQEPVLFNDTIRYNVTLGDQAYSDTDIFSALEQAGLKDQITSLEMSIGERGLALSGGQRQRLMIARALIRNPKLLILDEATTGLDPKTEKAILKVLSALPSTVTILAISHQPAIAEVADQVFRIKEGTILT